MVPAVTLLSRRLFVALSLFSTSLPADTAPVAAMGHSG